MRKCIPYISIGTAISKHSKNVTHKINCMLDLYQHLSNKTMSVDKCNVGDLGAKCASRSELRI